MLGQDWQSLLHAILVARLSQLVLGSHLMDMVSCRYCGAEVKRGSIVMSGWILAKNRPFEYACKVCAPIDKSKDKRREKSDGQD